MSELLASGGVISSQYIASIECHDVPITYLDLGRKEGALDQSVVLLKQSMH